MTRRARSAWSETPAVMTRGLGAGVLVALALATPAVAAVRVVEPFPLDRTREAERSASRSGAGPTVTRESALNTLLTGEVELCSSAVHRRGRR